MLSWPIRYGWRNQIEPWRDAGYRVVVPDMLGYGGTDKPHDPAEYTTKKLCNDLAALLDLLDVRKAVLIGHDWGAYVVGRFALWHPQRLLALVMWVPVSLSANIKMFTNGHGFQHIRAVHAPTARVRFPRRNDKEVLELGVPRLPQQPAVDGLH